MGVYVKKLSAAATLWLGVSAAIANPLAGDFVTTDANSGCRVFNPHPRQGETANWSGACVNGLAQGPGRLQWINNGKSTEQDAGVWNEGRQSGHGSQDWFSGRYDGEISNGEPEGRGVLTLRTARYEGEFRNGKPNGTGSVTSLQGVFTGTWKDGCLVGDQRRIAFAVPSSECR
jgi:hypothetical protein